MLHKPKQKCQTPSIIMESVYEKESRSSHKKTDENKPTVEQTGNVTNGVQGVKKRQPYPNAKPVTSEEWERQKQPDFSK